MPTVTPQLKSIFSAALELESVEDRNAYLDEACRDQAALRSEIESLLAAHGEGDAFISQFVAGVASIADIDPLCDLIGSQVGPYVLREQIGEGGMGVVYVAEQMEPVKRKVALKIIKPGMDTRQVIARFEAERQTLALMDHPHIAKVYDGGATKSGRPFFVMELVQGIPITELCDEYQLSVEQRLKLFVDVCQAIQHAHQKGIIHRDIKPSNVLVALHDDKPFVKVIDFGIAKAIDQELVQHTLYTHFAQMVGTPAYMSPEQAELRPLGVDTRSDIYSLGVLLYELLAGATPIDKERLDSASYDELRRIIRDEEPLRPSVRISTMQANFATTVSERRHTAPVKLSQQLCGELDSIVLKCLEKDRSRRYATASALADDVERFLKDEPTVARPPSTAYRCRKFVRRNRILVASLSAVLISLTLGTVLATAGFLNARAQRNLAQQAEATAQRQLEGSRVLADLLEDILPGPEWHTNTLGQQHTVYKAIEKVSPTLERDLRDHPAVEIKVRRIFGRAYTAASEFDKARNHLNLALQLAEREYGQEHKIVAAIHAQLADEVGWNQSPRLDYPTLLAHAEKAIKIYGTLGQEVSEPASEPAWFAKAFCLLNWPERWADAEAAQRKHVELSQRDGSVGGIIPLWDLGVLLIYLGDDHLDLAKVELEKAVTAARLQSNPLLQATAIGGLGRCQRRQGDMSLAIQSFEQAWELYQSKDELKRDPRGYEVGFRLAESHFAAGNVDLAFVLAREIEQQSQDGGTPELQADALFFKGWLCFQLEDYELAAKWFKKSMDLAAKQLGSQHRKFAYACGYRALSLEASDRRKEAALLFEDVLPFTTAGANLPFASAEMYWRHCTALLGTIGDNASQMEIVLDFAQKGQDHVGIRSWTWQEPVFHLLDAEVHRRRNQHQAAIEALREGLGNAKEPHATYRASRYDVPTMRSELEFMLANLLVLETRQDEAREVLMAAVQKRVEHLKNPEHLQVALAQLRLGEFLIAQPDFAAAEQPLLQAHEKLLQHSDVVNPLRRRAGTKLVELYQITGQPKEAATWQATLDTLDLRSEINDAG